MIKLLSFSVSQLHDFFVFIYSKIFGPIIDIYENLEHSIYPKKWDVWNVPMFNPQKFIKLKKGYCEKENIPYDKKTYRYECIECGEKHHKLLRCPISGNCGECGGSWPCEDHKHILTKTEFNKSMKMKTKVGK